MIDHDAPVIIIGGGFAGLTAAVELERAGISFELHEAAPTLAGLARSFVDSDGFTNDFGAHLATNRLAREVGVLDQCTTVERFGESVWLRGRARAYPFGLLRSPRFVAGALSARCRAQFSSRPENCAEFFRATLGTPLAEEVAIPVIEALNGVPATTLVAAAGDRLPGIVRTLYLKSMSRLTRHAIAIGYALDLPETRHVWHVYPIGGIEVFCRKLAAGIGAHVHLDSRVEKILVEAQTVTGVVSNGIRRAARAVISTAPVDVLASMIDGSTALRPLADFRYCAMIIVNLRFAGRGLLPNIVVWTPERRTRFYRLTEPPAAIAHLAPDGKTLIAADITAEVGDAHWTMDDAELGARCVEDLERIVPGIGSRYLGASVLRTRLGYPVMLNAYEDFRLRFGQSTGIKHLVSTGRNGEFAHILMEDVHHRTKARVGRLIDELRVEHA